MAALEARHESQMSAAVRETARLEAELVRAREEMRSLRKHADAHKARCNQMEADANAIKSSCVTLTKGGDILVQ